MAVKNTTQVLIGGKIITLSGYESEEYLQKVASYMNNKMTELGQLPGYSRQSVETKHTSQVQLENARKDVALKNEQIDKLQNRIEELEKELEELLK